MKSKLMHILTLGLMIMSIFISLSQITAKANDPTCCQGVWCEEQQNCGSTACFCNRPSSTCYADSANSDLTN